MVNSTALFIEKGLQQVILGQKANKSKMGEQALELALSYK